MGTIFLVYVFILISTNKFTRGAGDVSNAIERGNDGRAIVNTAMRIGKARGKIVAGRGKRCAVGGMSPKRMLIFSVVNVGAIRGAMNDRGQVSMLVSTKMLVSRIMIANCRARHGISLAKSMSDLDSSRFVRAGPLDLRRTLGKGVSNIRMVGGSNTPNNKVAVGVHKTDSVATNDSPLCIVSNFPLPVSSSPLRDPLTAVSPSTVRDVSVLGSMSSATVCKTRKTGNIILVAAGGKSTNVDRVSIGTACNVDGLTGSVPVLNTRSCVHTCVHSVVVDKH